MFNIGRRKLFAIIHPAQKGFNNILGLFLAIVLDETVIEVLAGERPVDLKLFVVLVELGKYTTRYFPVYAASR